MKKTVDFGRQSKNTGTSTPNNSTLDRDSTENMNTNTNVGIRNGEIVPIEDNILVENDNRSDNDIDSCVDDDSENESESENEKLLLGKGEEEGFTEDFETEVCGDDIDIEVELENDQNDNDMDGKRERVYPNRDDPRKSFRILSHSVSCIVSSNRY